MKVLALLLVSGCSFVLVRGPDPHRPAALEPKCTDTDFPPIFDTIAFALSAGFAIDATRDLASYELPPDGDTFGRELRRTQRNLLASAAIIELGAATYGYITVARCRRAKHAYVQPTVPR